MKKLILIVFLTGFLFNSCKILDDVTTFNIDLNSSFNIDANTVANTSYIIGLEIPTGDITTALENNNTHADLVDEINITNCIMNITSPNGGTFEFLEQITVFVNADGLTEKRIAWSSTLNSNNNITLILYTETNLKDYLTSDSFSIHVEGLNNQDLTEDYHVDLDMSFVVNAQLVGR